MAKAAAKRKSRMSKDPVAEKMALRQAIRERLAAAKDAFPEACEREHAALIEQQSAEYAPNRFIQKRGGEARLDADDKRHLKALQDRVEPVEQAAATATQTRAELEREINDLEHQLAEMQGGISLDALLKHQAAIREMEGNIDRVDRLLGAQQALIDKPGEIVSEFSASLDELSAERREALADIAEGNVDEAILTDIDARIATLEARRDVASKPATQAARQAKQTIAGLQPRRAKFEARRVALVDRTRDVLEDFLISHAERLGADYCKAAKRTVTLYLRILAVQQILADQGSKRRVLPVVGWAALSMPAPTLKALDKDRYHNDPHMLYELSKELYGPVIAKPTEDELAHFKSSGVDLFG